MYRTPGKSVRLVSTISLLTVCVLSEQLAASPSLAAFLIVFVGVAPGQLHRCLSFHMSHPAK